MAAENALCSESPGAVAQTLPASSVSISVMPSISSNLPLNHSRASPDLLRPRDATGDRRDRR